MRTSQVNRDWLAEQQRAAAQRAASAKSIELGLDHSGRPPDFSYFGRERATWTCPQCGTVRTFTPMTASGEPGDLLTEPGASEPCPCVAAAEVAAMQRVGAQLRSEVVEASWQEAGVPDRYVEARFSNFTARKGTEAALAACRKYVRMPDGGLSLIGNVGAGKTHLAVATARALLERDLICPRFVNVQDLVVEVQRGDAARYVNLAPVDQAVAGELVILDDLGQAPLTDLGHRVVWQLVSGLYERCARVLVTTNASDRQLEERLSPAIVSRLYEMTRAVELTATDYRRETVGRKPPSARTPRTGERVPTTLTGWEHLG